MGCVELSSEERVVLCKHYSIFFFLHQILDFFGLFFIQNTSSGKQDEAKDKKNPSQNCHLQHFKIQHNVLSYFVPM